MTKLEAHEYNLDAAYRQIEMRDSQGEDMSNAYVDENTYEIKKLDYTSIRMNEAENHGMCDRY